MEKNDERKTSQMVIPSTREVDQGGYLMIYLVLEEKGSFCVHFEYEVPGASDLSSGGPVHGCRRVTQQVHGLSPHKWRPRHR